jgi:hypothetical protein
MGVSDMGVSDMGGVTIQNFSRWTPSKMDAPKGEMPRDALI